ncbi:hypothetical protein [Stenotrophomonas geniculata]|uniref:hypothetical protein n=1 Tax=Stenotrophomonas geniculata TaxID=86188 RepID=UPI002E77B05E|nr:hypothetical protein [Stenotrophomonas geniculata]
MTTDNKTLADVQPGGRVRLGDGLAVEKLARELLAKEWDGLHTEHMSWSDTESREVEEAWFRSIIAALLRGQAIDPPGREGGHRTSVASARELLDLYADPIPVAVEGGSWFMVREQDALDAIRAALPAQPSPGGQGALKALDDLAAFCSDDTETVERHVAVIRAALAARQPVSETVAYQQGFRDGQDRTCTVAARQPVGQGDSRSEKAETFLRQYLTYLRSSPRQGLRPRWCDVYEALEVAIEALAARQPVGEPVALVVPGAPTRCRHCESTDLEWFAHVRAVNDVPHGRLTTHDVGCVFVLGCNECSETLHTVKADSIAALLAVPPAQAVDLGQLPRYSKSYSEGIYLDDAGDWVRFADVLALIDSQAVGNGN